MSATRLACCGILLAPVAALCMASTESAWETQLPRLQKLERSDPWEAARAYCEAARHGIVEAQYRLGMQYAFGMGVPENRAQAASLFSLASEQGHAEAHSMLETIRLSSTELPPCMLAEVAPERIPPGPGLRTDRLSPSQRQIVQIITQLAIWHDVDPQLAVSIAMIESGLNPRAVSPKSAAGIMQLMPATAERFNVKDSFNVSQNVRGGVRYLRWLIDRFDGNIELVAAGYNAGEKAVERYKGVPPYAETRNYVAKLRKLYPSTVHMPDRARWQARQQAQEQRKTARK
ncbi:lytic transglycosylase domain-containing protein [Chitinilyticum litopenaei]|uniref:lytic transglycosylase domain-containing protein n=1 Tax=Chitinilyticum litopenaei TaxID=1121276 RepID=UPI0004262E5F|nr:transglycosylase SLT domain-containing protein [Chitinilyticum litopenaei]